MLSINELVKSTNGKCLNGDLNFIPKKYVIDSRNIEENPFFVPIIGENTDGHKYIIDAVKSGICGYFINKSHKEKNNIVDESKKLNKDICIIEVEDTLKALYFAGRYNREKHINIPVVAVTGSVGKTSTREMIASVLRSEKNVLSTKANYNSVIGAPIMALEIEDQDVCVFELGTDHNGEMQQLSDLMKPNISVITVIGTAHIGIFESRENIFKEKLQITSHMPKESILFVNGDDIYLNGLKNTDMYEVEQFNDSDIVDMKSSNNGIKFRTKIYGDFENIEINQIGNHNAKNAVCAIKVAEVLNLKRENIIRGIKEYKNFARRLEKIELDNNILLIDDTYNASIDSMKSGLITINKFNGRKIAVLGDMLELGAYSKQLHFEIGKFFQTLNYNKLYLFGNESKYIEEGAKNFVNTKWYESKEELVSDLKSDMKSGDVIYFKASNGMKFNTIIEELKSR